nr:PD-(D/E)XK nuclease family protein [Clostridia bacterium]
GFSEQEIADIRKTTKKNNSVGISLWASVIKYNLCADSELYDKTIDEKIDSFKLFLDDIKDKSRYISVSTLLSYILSNSKMDAFLLSNDYYEGVDKLSEINQFIDYVSGLSIDEDVAEFLNYYDKIYDGIEKGSSDDSITLLTYHSSKGLEFDYVFMPELAASRGNDTRKYEKDYNFGIGITDYNEGIESVDENKSSKDTFPKLVIKKINSIKETKEGIRVFYVAATRAKKALWMSYILNKKDSLNWELRATKHSFYSIINKTPDLFILFSLFNANSIDATKISRYIEVIDEDSKIEDSKETRVRESSDKELFNEKDIFERKYKYEDATKTQGKYTVTEILIDSNNDAENSSMVNDFKNNEPEHIIVGNAIHHVLERIDLNANNKDKALIEIEKIHSKGLISDEEKTIAIENIDKIVAVLNLETIQEACSNEYQREKEFIMYLPRIEGNNDDKVMVQGAIDLLIKTKDGYIIADYKASRLGLVKLKDKYKKQLDTYAVAVENILKGKVIKCVLISIFKGDEVSWNREEIDFEVFKSLK